MPPINVSKKQKKGGGGRGSRRKTGKKSSSSRPAVGSNAFDFVGSTTKDIKEITCKDLGIPIGSNISVRRIRLEVVSDRATNMTVSLVDFSVTSDKVENGAQLADSVGPHSRVQLIMPGVKTIINHVNPNPRILWRVDNVGDYLATLWKTDDSSNITFSGTMYIDEPSTSVHTIS